MGEQGNRLGNKRQHRQLILVAILYLLLPACATYRSAGEELDQLVSRSADSIESRRAGEVTLESDHLSGVFQVALAVRSGPEPRLRMQLFPDLGGKLLDLAASTERIVGYFPQVRNGVSVGALDEEKAPRHILVFMGLTLLEASCPVTTDRVLSLRDSDEGLELVLQSSWPGLSVRAFLDGSGKVIERRYSFRGARWKDRTLDHETLLVEGSGFSLTARLDPVEVEEEPLPDSLFVLKLPEGIISGGTP